MSTRVLRKCLKTAATTLVRPTHTCARRYHIPALQLLHKPNGSHSSGNVSTITKKEKKPAQSLESSCGEVDADVDGIIKTLRDHTMEARLRHMRKEQQYLPPYQHREKTPSESKIKHVIPLGSDKELRTHFIQSGGGIRIGRLLEEMDILAGAVGYAHAEGFHPERKVTIVTASVDRIELLNPIIPYFDITLEGCVTYTGKSSMEIRILISQQQSSLKSDEHVQNMVAYFTMVSRLPYENKAAQVHSLKTITEDEKRLFALGVQNREIRKQSKADSLSIYPPNDEERDLLHSLFLTHKEENDTCSITSTTFRNITIMHPDKANIHGKVFGGHLLRIGYELAHSTVYMHGGSAPHFISLDENHFIHPVELGSLCSVSAQITYTKGDLAVVRCEVEVLNVQTGKHIRTNVFHFTFQSIGGFRQTVIPVTYQEGITYLEGRRTYTKGKQFALAMRQN